MEGIVPCIACGVDTSNPHCFCCDTCFESYHDTDLLEAEVLAGLYAEFDEAYTDEDSGWQDDGR